MKREEVEKLSRVFVGFCQTIAALRDPESGCPWDLKQDHASLRKYMIEEAYEAATEMEGNVSTAELCEELGDVLLQVVLNAQVAKDKNAFTISDVVQSIDEKMIRRHPHVFERDQHPRDEKSIKRNWERIKEEEKRSDHKKLYFSKAEKIQPSTSKAEKIGKLASKINFDWERPEQVVDQLQSELDELKEALRDSKKPSKDKSVEAELADIYFTLAQVSRHLGYDAEATAHLGNDKFLKRFEVLEKMALEKGLDILQASQAELESLWQKAKNKSPL